MPTCRKRYCGVTFYVDRESLEQLKRLVEEGWFMTTSQAIQFAIYLLVIRYRNITNIE